MGIIKRIKMQLLEALLEWSINLSVIINAVVIYLNVNKIWSRKHESVVAESISVAGQLISFLTILPFVISYSFQGKYPDTTYQLLWLIYTSFLILIGIGFWVKEHTYLGIWQKFLRSLKQEKKEIGNLVKYLGNASEKQLLVTILNHLAWLDGKLDEREQHYIKTFTEQLGIEYELVLDNYTSQKSIDQFKNLCQSVQQYLANNPPTEQVKLLRDLVHALIAVDEKITLEEEIIAEEIEGIIHNYTDKKILTVYQIIIHPKNLEQEKAIFLEIPTAKQEYILGDSALIVESFYTQRYAEIISESYREKGWFTVVYKTSQPEAETSRETLSPRQYPNSCLQNSK